MMNEESLQSSSPSGSDLVISDDSQAARNGGLAVPDGMPEPSGEERTAVDSISSDLASNDLLPHPDTEVFGPTSRFPEPEPSDSNAPVSPLTPEIFASGTLPAGTQLGHFVIKSFIGGGGMGRVYLATDTALDRKVAVKVLPRQRANDQGTVARFMNEAKSAARLNHEHIAQVYFAGEQAGIPFIVFEYVEGTNIRTMVNDFDAFPLPQALNYLIQISHALAHAAEHGVVHRDVKPSNILITREGRAKLIDMGLARLLDPSASQDDLTASGVTLGTFDYISPEQARDPRNADIRSDIYSLGCTFFYMLSGRPPFPEGTVLQKLLQHQGDEPPDIRSFQPNIPAEVALLIQKMMAKEPRQRFQTPAALIDALVNVAKMLGLQPTGPGKLVWVMTPPSRTSVFLKHIPWLLAVVFLFVAFFLMNLYTERRGALPLQDLPEHIVAVDRPGGDEGNPPLTTPQVNRTRTTESRGRPSFRVESYASWRFEAPTFRGVFSLPGDSSLSGSFRAASRLAQERSGRGLGPSDRDSAEIGPLEGKKKPGAALNALDVFSRGGPGTLPHVGDGVPPPRLLCVDPDGAVSGSYPTLAAALLDAGKNATIELRWNNVQAVDSFTLADSHIRFVAAEGFYPVLQFRPATPKSLFRVTDCELEFRDLALEMRISPTILAESWSMFNLAGANRIRVERTSMTLRNKSLSDNSANHDDVAFFRNGVGAGAVDMFSLESSPSGTPGVFDPMIEGAEALATFEPTVPVSPSPEPVSSAVPSTESERLEIVFADSILRGEASAFRCDVPQAVDIEARNTFFALAMPFVRTDDTRRTTPQETAVRIHLDRTTFFGRQSFASQIQRSYDTHPIRLEIDAAHSIFFLNNAPLSVFRGAPSPQGAYDYFKWTGEANYFQSVSLGWRFRADTSRSSGGLDYSMSLDDWKNTMNRDNENDARRATKIDVLRFEEIRKPTHLLLPKDLTPQFLPEAGVDENEKKTVGADPETFDWMRRSWSGEE